MRRGPRPPKGSPFEKGTCASSQGQKGLGVSAHGRTNYKIPKATRELECERHLPECYLGMEAGGTSPRPGSVVSRGGGAGAGKEESSGRRSLLALQEPTLDGLLLLS